MKNILTGGFAFSSVLVQRALRLQTGAKDRQPPDLIQTLASNLHPKNLELRIDQIRDETPSTRTYKLVLDPESERKKLPFFRAGQYISLKLDIGESTITRAYSISSSPVDGLNQNFYDITIRKRDGGFLTDHIWNNWVVGTKVRSSGPVGQFYVDDLRDSRHIVGLAGGCGITPFRSIVRDMIETSQDSTFLLIYGIADSREIIFKDYFESLEKQYPEKFKALFVHSEPDKQWCGPTGFLTKDLIEEHTKNIDDPTFFICGPQAMYNFVDGQLQDLGVPKRRIRKEVFGEVVDVKSAQGYPDDHGEKTYSITAFLGSKKEQVPAKSTESVLVALERVKLAPPSQCRSGQCSLCNARLKKGDIFVIPEDDGRRTTAKKHCIFHPCASYPLSDLEIEL